MNGQSRREFGVRILQAAAALGLRSIAGSRIAQLASMGSAVAVAGCDDVPLVVGHSDVVVVGSGYGGAVVAKRLTARGLKVLMLEMGRFWNQPASDGKIFCSIKNADGRAMWFRDNISVITSKLSPVVVSQPIAK